MVGVIHVYIDMVLVLFVVVVIFCLFFFSLCSWMFQHDCLDTCCFECFLCIVLLYLHLFSAIEHVSHGKALLKYAHYYYYHY